MSSIGYVDSLLNTLEPAVKKTLDLAFREVIQNFQLGDGPKATNARWFRLTGTTAAVANTEFSILHGMDVEPALLIPVIDLTAIGSQLVSLTVTKAPDAKRIYLSSPSTSAVVTLYAE